MRRRTIGLVMVILWGCTILAGGATAQSSRSELEKATALDQQLIPLYQQGKFAEAMPLAEEALTIRERVLGPDHPDVARSLNEVALLNTYLGDYPKAEALHKRALAIREQALGPDHPDVAASLNNLARLYLVIGDYAKAEPLYQKALAMREQSLGPDHPHVAMTLSNLGYLYTIMGDYAKAEPLLQRAVTILEKVFGPEHRHVATSLVNLAMLYQTMGEYQKSEPLYLRSLAIQEKVLGTEHRHVAANLNNLATVYVQMGEHAKAEPYLKRTISILEKSLGPDHPEVGTSVNNLGLLYYEMGDLAKAEPLYRRALAIREKSLRPDHPDIAASLNNLGELYRVMGDYPKAEPFYKKSLTIWEKALGTEHPNVARSLENLSLLYAARDESLKAHELQKRAQDIDEIHIDQVMGFVSDERKLKFLAAKSKGLHAYIGLVATRLSQDRQARKDALDVWLRRKGIVLEAQRRFQEALAYSDDPRATAAVQELARVRGELSRLTFAGPGKEGLAVHRKKLSTLQAEKERLETELVRLSRTFALQKKVERADSEKVARVLPQGSVLLELVQCPLYHFKVKPGESKWLPARYLAFLLHAGSGDKIGLVDLGDAETIDRAVVTFKEAISGFDRDPMGAGASEAAKTLYQLIFAPIEKELGSSREIFVSPDGNLNLIPFEVLQRPDGRYLIEDYRFNYLASGRDLLRFGEIEAAAGKPLLVGDPDFGLGSDEKDATLKRMGLEVKGERHIAKRSVDMRGFRMFQRLPGTGEEIEAVSAILGANEVSTRTRAEALEEVLMQAEAPRILHLATHGFFLKDVEVEPPADDDAPGSGLVTEGPSALKADRRQTPAENPLLRSGLALAGANSALGGDDPTRSDGLLTAEKVLGLKLRGTDLVVLSACETGLGEVKAGDGVYGLRRAFLQAGTKSLVMSLWSVPDKETKELMTTFYENLKAGKMNRSEALRQAALKQRDIVEKRYGHPHPFFWGAFVFLGEP